MKSRRLWSFLLILGALLGCLTGAASAAEPELKVTVNGDPVAFSQSLGQPFINGDSRTMVPLRAAGEAMGLTVEWDGSKNAASFRQEYDVEAYPNQVYSQLKTKTVVLYVNSQEYEIVQTYVCNDGDGKGEYTQQQVQTASMDTAVVNQNQRTYAPIRYLAEAFGYDVVWDGAKKTVKIEDELPYSTNYGVAYSVENGAVTALYLGFTKGVNISEVRVDSLVLKEVRDSGGKKTEMDQTIQDLTPLTASEKEQVKSAVNLGDAIVTGVRAPVNLAQNRTYAFAVRVSVTKTNGSVKTLEFTVNLDVTN